MTDRKSERDSNEERKGREKTKWHWRNVRIIDRKRRTGVPGSEKWRNRLERDGNPKKEKKKLGNRNRIEEWRRRESNACRGKRVGGDYEIGNGGRETLEDGEG